MILTPDEVEALRPALGWDTMRVKMWLEGAEAAIKRATNNDFWRHRGPDGEIQWPADIKKGVLDLLDWDASMEGKRGMASETISRHSVSYRTLTAAESEGGYPADLISFIDPYRRARF